MGERTRSRNGKIDLLRFLFSLVIVIHHSRKFIGDEKCLFLGGSFGVEFFFVVSGYLMMASIERLAGAGKPIDSLGSETLGFIGRKIKGFWAEVLVGWAVAMTFVCICLKRSLKETVYFIIETIYEPFLLQMTGIRMSTVDGVIWYLSSMLLCMMVLYPLVRRYKDVMTKIVLPLLIVLIFGWLCQNYDNPRNPQIWLGLTYKGNIRAFAEISAGVVLYSIVQQFKQFQYTKLGKRIITISEYAIYILIFVFMEICPASKRDCFFFVLLCIAVGISFGNKGIDVGVFDNGICYWLGKYSLSLYLSHSYYASYMNKLPFCLGLSDENKMYIYIGVSCITALFVMYCSNALRKISIPLVNAVKRKLIEEV